MTKRWRPLLVDANVLIDFASSDLTVITLVATQLSPVHVLRPSLAEVGQLAATDCDRLRLHIAEPSLDQPPPEPTRLQARHRPWNDIKHGESPGVRDSIRWRAI